MILESEFNEANKMKAINTLAMPIVTYSFNIIKWKLNSIKRLDATTRKNAYPNEDAPPKIRYRVAVYNKTVRRSRSNPS